MSLNSFAAERRLKLLDELKKGIPPSEGSYDASVLAEARTKGEPQLGSTRFLPDQVILEFIYPDASTSATILSVSIPSPERIVFLPVPGWVVENIWQGDIDGTFQFESDALRLLEEFRGELTPEGNQKWFEKRLAKRRE
jgi:hypothetical protein